MDQETQQPESPAAKREPVGLFIGGRWTRRTGVIEVRNSYDGHLVDVVSSGTAEDMQEAVDAAAGALGTDFPTHARHAVLMRAAALVEEQQDEYARIIAAEGSKTIREARREPPRSAHILRLSAEEGRRLAGETLPFDSRVGSENRIGYYFRFPVGVVGAITPFNDPLAMAAHKIGPAIAAGNSVVLKPASATPLSALHLARDLQKAGLPPGRLNVVPGRGEELGAALVSDPRVRLVSFTGGVATGEWITRHAG
ncbi:MAG: aldehyde dehydrogenase family protein, partial [Acidobacteria bacterium]|nr:aldehyde dehydrogenase family protein [Acidobacteriota bacterium]